MIAAGLGLVRGKDAWDQLIEHWPSEEIPPPDSMTEWITSMLTTSYIQKTITGGNVINIPLSEACVGSAVLVGLDYTEIPSSDLETIQEYETEFGKLTHTSVIAKVSGTSPKGFSFRFSTEESLELNIPIIIYGVLKGSQIIAASRVEKTYPALLAKGGGALFESIGYVRRPTSGPSYIVEEVITLKDGRQYRALATSDKDGENHPKDNSGGFKIDGGDGVISVESSINWGMLGAALAENKILAFTGASFSGEYTWNFTGGMNIRIRVSRPTALPAIYEVTFNGLWSSIINGASDPVIKSIGTDSNSTTGYMSVSGWVTFSESDPDLGAYIYLQTTDSGYLLVKTRYTSTISGSADDNVYMWQ